MLPSITFLVAFVQYLSILSDIVDELYLEDTSHTINLSAMSGFLNVIVMLLEIITYVDELLKDRSWENDAYKLIKFFKEYR